MKNISASLAEALAEGAVIIPNVIFAGLIYPHYGNYHFLLPFVLLYSFEKAGVFAIQGFGSIKNPYKILEYCLLMSILGAIFCVFGTLNPFLWNAGAILIGMGLANYTSLFRTIRDLLKKTENPDYKNILVKGYLLLGIIMGFSMFFRHTTINIVFIVFLIILIVVFVFIHRLDIGEEMRSQPLFEKHKNSQLRFLPAIAMLIFTFFTRILKQTSNVTYITYMGLAFSALIVISAFLKKMHFNLNSMQTLWFGAIRNFLTIYSLIYFIAIDKSYMVSLSYTMIALGIMLSMFIKKKLNLIFPNRNLEAICLLLSMTSLLLLLSSHTYLLGVMLCCAFVATGNSLSLKKFTTDSSLPILERRIIRSKFYALGAVFQQAILLSVLIIISWIKTKNGGTALSAYALSNGTPSLQNIFFYVKAICIFFINLIGVCLTWYTVKKS